MYNTAALYALQNAGKCMQESLKFQNFPGKHAPNPPCTEAASGILKYYRPAIRNYPLVPKHNETPGIYHKLNKKAHWQSQYI